MRVRTTVNTGGKRWRIVCRHCHKGETVPQTYLVRMNNPKRNCSCQMKARANPYPREKGIWTMMHRRCYNNRHVAYKHYGGAGIYVCERWHGAEGWLNFIKDVGPAPSTGHSLDRIDPYGPYSPTNVRWATAKQQANNQKRHWLKPEDRVKKSPD
ncbi:MAG: hypothetical protein ACRDBG_23470 [Waterburya sp.]